MSKPVITLTTDFGDSFAPAQLELVVNGINPDVKFISVENNVTDYSILEGAFILSKFYEFAPKGSIHIGVVDPGVGSDRKGLIIKTKNHWFVGPDNGLFYPAATQDGIEKVFTINEEVLGSLSNTFHGRDVFAKVAAYISINRPIEEFTVQYNQDDIVKLEFQENQILHIDPYGNIKLNADCSKFELGKKYTIQHKDKKVSPLFCRTFTDVQLGEYLIYGGSHTVLELSINQGDAAKELELKIGDILQIQ